LKGRKHCFFEKTKQETCSDQAEIIRPASAQFRKSFLVLFSESQTLFAACLYLKETAGFPIWDQSERISWAA
jgi:hypothetical protein